MNAHRSTIAVLVVLLGILYGCDRNPESRGPRVGATSPTVGVSSYRLALNPLHNPAKHIQAYQPLVDYLKSAIECQDKEGFLRLTGINGGMRYNGYEVETIYSGETVSALFEDSDGLIGDTHD